jgi:hypothetical protein
LILLADAVLAVVLLRSFTRVGGADKLAFSTSVVLAMAL